ncbi:MAG: type I methionyl aminopeptidase [Gammaproteobacteria bacterium]|jgi:methionyl aminopeptidase|nr:type I methionyl aminopeptidase [Gammaproteobacteria bacterium]MDP6146542.1 type I methionyl aminopeptidase [Gammaproteobacteria bacterium]HJL79524.1 type I methionyl aminopeptidase [Gammaproteobacteria bacterium]HJN00237.1 type I methionyl aminopeptidase [Gammaproteobacteria bacterium]|tara:strand:- start:4801 stop:5568 length:768 start_codon:yes stop_codon:yes gene_type:complete
MSVEIKTQEQQEKMRIAGKLASEVLDMISDYVKPGISTLELDEICNDYIINTQKTIPANVGYRGFPATTCTSINHVVCHGIPSEKRLKNGDILNIDITIIKDGFHGDTSRMFIIGKIPNQAQKLIDVTYQSMCEGIRVVKPGNKLGDIGYAIQRYAEENYFSVVKEYCGHGIGEIYHDEPQILHYGISDTGMELKSGMTFTIEPMINLGGSGIRLLSDGWTVVTKDHSLSAQWEHTILVTDDGYEVLTLSPGELI